MSFKPIQKLTVTRTLSSGDQIAVGVLAQNRQGVFFQYAGRYLQQFGSLSPSTLQASTVKTGRFCKRMAVNGILHLFTM